MLVPVGDFNAETESGLRSYPNAMEKFGKGEITSSGHYLLQLLTKHNLIITNTLQAQTLP